MRTFHYLFSLTIALVITSCANGDVLLLEDFEDATRNYTTSTPEFHDGGSDYFGIVPLLGSATPVDPYTGFGGSNFFAVEDMDDNNSKPGTATLSFSVNVAGFNNLSVDLGFAVGGNGAVLPAYDDEESFLVRASIDGGTIQNLIAFESSELLGLINNVVKQDTDFNGVGDGFQPTSAFTTFNNLNIGGTGTNLLVEVIITSNDGNSEFAMDDFQINGVSAVPEPSTTGFVGLLLVGALLCRRR